MFDVNKIIEEGIQKNPTLATLDYEEFDKAIGSGDERKIFTSVNKLWFSQPDFIAACLTNMIMSKKGSCQGLFLFLREICKLYYERTKKR